MTRPLTGDLVLHKSGIYIREGTCDEYVPGQQNEYKELDFQDRYVLDLGGHIGAFARFAIDRGAAQVISVEPHEPNCEVWRLNLSGYKHAILDVAAVVNSSYEYDELPLYLCAGDTSGHSTLSIRGRGSVMVPAKSLEHYLSDYEPEVVKIDIEGSEYDLLQDISMFLDYDVEEFACELHLHLRDWRVRAEEFVKVVEQWYDPVVPARIGAKNWNTTGVWRIKRGKPNKR